VLPLFKALKAAKEYIVLTYGVAKPYWTSEHKKTAWGLLLGVLALQSINLYLSGQVSYATKDLMDALDNKEFDAFWDILFYWSGLFMLILTLYMGHIHLQNVLIINWREFLTNRYQNRYFKDGLFNQMGLKDYDVDNPDQRISQDMHNIAEETLELVLSIYGTLGTLGLFGYILWDVSGAIQFTLFDVDFNIPGYMLWVAVLYASLSIYLTHKIGKPMMFLNFERQRVEADFRFHLIRLRENSESVSLLKGEDGERHKLKQEFAYIRGNWLELLKYKKRLFALNMGMGQFSNIFPYIAAMPAMIAGNIALGGLLQIRQAFATVEGSLSWFANRYQFIAQWKASVDRVILLEKGIVEAESDKKRSQLLVSSNGDNKVNIENLTVKLPTGDVLTENLNVNFTPGKNVVITGASGSGKSTLFRAISGLWIWGKGVVNNPKDIMFLPQKPYLPQTSLREVLAYPHEEHEFSDVRLKRVMDLCLLSKLTDKLDDVEDWAKILSGGEQQRVSFVRALLDQPNWLFLDESTSALDPETEATIYRVLKSELPDTTLISIAHRESLRQYHDNELKLDPITKSFEFKAI